MPKLTLSMFEPIEIEIKGADGAPPQVFKIEVLSSKMLNDFLAAVKGFSEKPEEVTPDQIGGILVKVLPGITMEQALSVDFRHVLSIANYLAEQINAAAKPGASAEKN
jgi:hypothetical protein